MKHKTKKPSSYHKHQNNEAVRDDLFERCIQKGLIEKTEYGYYFKPEFFETLDIYDEEY